MGTMIRALDFEEEDSVMVARRKEGLEQKERSKASQMAIDTKDAITGSIATMTEVMKKTLTSMAPTALIARGLRDELTGILSTLATSTDLVQTTEVRQGLEDKFAAAEAKGDTALMDMAQKQLDALTTIESYKGSDGAALIEKLLNKESLDSEEAKVILDSARNVTAAIESVQVDTNVQTVQVLDKFNALVKDERLGNSFRKQVAQETLAFLQADPAYANNPQLGEIEKLLAKDGKLNNNAFNRVTDGLDSIKTGMDRQKTVNEMASSAIEQLNTATTTEGRKHALNNIQKSLEDFPEYQKQLLDIQQTYGKDGKMTISTSKKSLEVLKQLKEDTNESKMVYNLQELNSKFDSAVLNNKQLESGLASNNLGERFKASPNAISTGKGMASTGVSLALNSMGLGNLDAQFGISDMITNAGASGMGNLMEGRGVFGGERGSTRGRMSRMRGGMGRMAGRASGMGRGMMGRVGGMMGGIRGMGRGGRLAALAGAGIGGIGSLFMGGMGGTNEMPTSQVSRMQPQADPRMGTQQAGNRPGIRGAMGRAGGKASAMGKGAMGMMKGMGSKALKFLGPLGMIASLGMGAYDGVGRAGELAGLKDGEEADLGQKTKAGFAGIAESLTFGLLDAKTAYSGLDAVSSWFGGGDKKAAEDKAKDKVPKASEMGKDTKATLEASATTLKAVGTQQVLNDPAKAWDVMQDMKKKGPYAQATRGSNVILTQNGNNVAMPYEVFKQIHNMDSRPRTIQESPATLTMATATKAAMATTTSMDVIKPTNDISKVESNIEKKKLAMSAAQMQATRSAGANNQVIAIPKQKSQTPHTRAPGRGDDIAMMMMNNAAYGVI